MEKITRVRGRETNTAQGEAECYIRLETKPECYLFHIALVAVLQLLAGLFEQIAKVLLVAIEQQVTRKVRSLTLYSRPLKSHLSTLD